MVERGDVVRVWVGDELPLSDEAFKTAMLEHGPGIEFRFNGSMRLSDRTYAIWLDCQTEYNQLLLYNLGRRFPSKVKLGRLVLTVRALIEQGNCLEIEVP